ncbi:Uncharacterised protein [Halioglobus japonicus]|nr:Uncharacterised protein [Halioglobus japonicus]
MKYMLCVVFSCFAASAYALPMVSLNPSTSVLGFNEAFTVDVLVSGIESTDQLIAFGFDVGVDTGLTYSGATVSPSFFDDSGFFPTTDVAGSSFPPISGDNILLATLSLMTGTTSGLLTVAALSTPLDPGLSEGLFTVATIYDISATATVEVMGSSTVPLPSTLLLIGIGLFGVAKHIRRA